MLRLYLFRLITQVYNQILVLLLINPKVYDRLEKIFLAIKNEQKETQELGLLLKKYALQSGNLTRDEMRIVKDQFMDF
ncbi:MAG: hypothetical protein CM1200mP10_33190 [Candidatus Neomarinimicrobiota bacterium]|nr:MAG: hypothetical protein CM1200mP10_33190 [Candidatus Neomarinimicrobiota bacterium]